MLWSSNTPFSYACLPAVSSDIVIPSNNDTECHWIRTLRLSSSWLQKSPQCKLRRASLRLGNPDGMTYRAVSYVHGSGDDAKDIQVNGKQLNITKNLYDCLNVMAKNGKRWGDLWVDQICIDMSNTAERNRQVERMREVYQQAQEVVVWLGQDLYSDMAAVNLVEKTFERESGGQKVELNHHQLDLLTSFAKNPYFTRLWAVQELVLGRRITFVVGNREFDWKRLVTVCRNHIFERLPSSLRDVNVDCSSLQRVLIAQTQKTTLDILDVINGFCNFECSDPRDHLFGLFGLLQNDNGSSTPNLSVDYTLSAEAAYLNFCYDLLQSIPETDFVFDVMVKLGIAMGFEGVFYDHCSEEELFNFFGMAQRNGDSQVKAAVKNRLQSRVLQFQDAAKALAMDAPVEYDMLSGKRIFTSHEV